MREPNYGGILPADCACGSTASLVDGKNLSRGNPSYVVRCVSCEASGPEESTFQKALAAWNRQRKG